jgi:hypothetical protein
VAGGQRFAGSETGGVSGFETFGLGDLVKVDCAACHHVALLTPEPLLSELQGGRLGWTT